MKRQPRDRFSQRTSLVCSIGALLLLGPPPAPAGAAVPRCGGKQATIVGTAGPDNIVATPGADVIVARGGKDTIRSRGGADRICSGAGNDRIFAGGDDDRVWAGKGDDLINGGKGSDRVDGGPGIDTCRKSEVLKNCEEDEEVPAPLIADLDVDVQGPANVSNNEEPDWSFHYSNKGPSPAPGTRLTITFAPRLTVTTLPSGCVEGPADTVTCQLGEVGAQGSGQVVISAQTPGVCDDPQTDTFVVGALIDAAAREPASANNTDSHATAYQDGGC